MSEQNTSKKLVMDNLYYARTALNGYLVNISNQDIPGHETLVDVQRSLNNAIDALAADPSDKV